MGESNFVRSQLLAAAIVGVLSTAVSAVKAADAPETKELSKISEFRLTLFIKSW